MDFVAFDLETTGLDPEDDEIVEIAAIGYRGRERVGAKEDIIAPKKRISEEAAQVHGISNEQAQREGVPWDDVKDTYRKALTWADAHCAYNSDFDIAFLKEAMDFPERPVLDPFWVAQQFIPKDKLARKNLSSLCTYLGIKVREAHRAEDDTTRTVEVLFELCDEYDLELEKLIDDEPYKLGKDMIDYDPFDALYIGLRSHTG